MAEGRQISIAEKLTSQSTRAEQARTSAAPGADPLPAYAAAATRDAVLASLLKGQQLRTIKLDLISPAAGGQARQQFDEERLQTLAQSLRRSGVREPILVTPHGDEPGRFQIVGAEPRGRRTVVVTSSPPHGSGPGWSPGASARSIAARPAPGQRLPADPPEDPVNVPGGGPGPDGPRPGHRRLLKSVSCKPWCGD